MGLCFFKEAEMLCRGEATDESVATVAGMVVLGAACTFHGNALYGQELLNSARGMAERLGLFGVPPDDPIALSLQSKSADWIKTASHTAWGTFSYLA